MDIPLPELLLRLRDRAKQEHIPSPGALPMGAFAHLATSPTVWRTSMGMAKMMNIMPLNLAPVKPLKHWLGQRTLPKSHGGEFRKWMKKHKD